MTPQLSSSADLLDAALSYARRGWPVFPCKTRAKTPLAHDWPNNATTDEATIREWWQKWPDANVGLVTGQRSGVVALDVDPKHGGHIGLENLEAVCGKLPDTVEQHTGGGGRHLLFRYPENGAVIRNSAGLIAPGLDVRGEGGYIVVAPSLHESGGVYTWEASSHPEQTQLADLPAWLFSRLRSQSAPSAAPPLGESEIIPEGRRNETLTSLAGSMRHRGMTRGAIEAALLVENQRCQPPLPDEEVREVARSVARYPATERNGHDQGRQDARLGQDRETQLTAKPGLETAVLTFEALTGIQLPEREHFLPWLCAGSITMIFGRRGVGKTMFGAGLASALVTGTPLLTWPACQPVGVLYVDGEMPLDELRLRFTNLLPQPPTAPLLFLTGEHVYHSLHTDLVLSSPSTRQEIVKILEDHPAIRVLILDNISCLFSGLDEDKKRDWEPISAWLIQLRHRGIATVLMHHAGKGGQQRGTSGREDALDVTIELEHPADHDARQGCRFHLQFVKSRAVKGNAVAPLEVWMNERYQLEARPLEVSREERARVLFHEGVTSPSDLADELGVSKGYASKLLKKFRNGAG